MVLKIICLVLKLKKDRTPWQKGSKRHLRGTVEGAGSPRVYSTYPPAVAFGATQVLSRPCASAVSETKFPKGGVMGQWRCRIFFVATEKIFLPEEEKSDGL